MSPKAHERIAVSEVAARPFNSVDGAAGTPETGEDEKT